MTALTAAYEASRKDGIIVSRPIIAAEKIYKGGRVILHATSRNAFSNDGATNTLSAGDLFGGIAVESIDNSTGLVAAKEVRCYCTGIFELNFPAGDNISSDDIGKKVYVNNTTDDNEVTITQDGGVDLCIGTIESLSTETNKAFVRIDGKTANADNVAA